MPALAKPPSTRATVRREAERGYYDRGTIHAILDSSLISHIGYSIDGQPFVTPTVHWRMGDHVCWHGSAASRMMRAQQERIPVCLTATLLDGIVYARAGFHHSVNYRSVMALGIAEHVQGEAALPALIALTERLAPGRWAGPRPPMAGEIAGTTILRLPLDEASAKIRTGFSHDELADYSHPIWAGLLPVKLIVGQPVPDPRLLPGIGVPPAIPAIWLG